MAPGPITQFKIWLQEELKVTKVHIPEACCLSTIGRDGYPNARFVALKEVVDAGFVITGPLQSRKGVEIAQHNKVALTFWWTATERQVRIQGTAVPLSTGMADKYFSARARESQIIAHISKQGETLESLEAFMADYDQALEEVAGEVTVPRPSTWGGYIIEPLRVEFLEFTSTRFHKRQLYELLDDTWKLSQLQP